MKICPNCGAQVPDDSTFCQTCGTSLSNTSGTNPQQNFVNASKEMFAAVESNEAVKKVTGFFDKSKIIILAVGVVAFIVLTIIINATAVLGPNRLGGHASVAKKYAKALVKEDKEAMFKLIDEDFCDDRDISKKNMSVDDTYLKKAKSIKILGASKYTDEEVESLCEKYSDDYGNYDDIKAAYTVYFSYVKGHKDPEISSVRVVKAGGKWRLYPSDIPANW